MLFKDATMEKLLFPSAGFQQLSDALATPIPQVSPVDTPDAVPSDRTINTAKDLVFGDAGIFGSSGVLEAGTGAVNTERSGRGCRFVSPPSDTLDALFDAPSTPSIHSRQSNGI
ncbi:unnamed protein product [Hydatigera taeniaeformis]|uniref:Uncharacterized protein n=1 Tax=Hydatigena taeniaeformis TaxID=6205 RepID=A0A0R3WNJ7_HYDTA|nr:unnamed protein product [Hydatigera taeniaeformis]